MAVPAHDTRDWEFAKAFGLPMVQVVAGPEGEVDISKGAFTDVETGVSVNSGFLTGLSVEDAKACLLYTSGGGGVPAQERLRTPAGRPGRPERAADHRTGTAHPAHPAQRSVGRAAGSAASHHRPASNPVRDLGRPTGDPDRDFDPAASPARDPPPDLGGADHPGRRPDRRAGDHLPGAGSAPGHGTAPLRRPLSLIHI